MPFFRPSLADLVARGEADVETRLPGGDARLRRSVLGVLVRVLAGLCHGLYGYLAWIARQILPDTAEAEMLDRHARIWLRDGRLPAAPAVGFATVTGTAGSVVPAGTIYKRTDGVRYATSADVELAGATAVVPLAAIEAGQVGNCSAGVLLQAETPVTGVAGTAAVTAAALTGGADVESDASLRARVLDRIQTPPMGGAQTDYVKWAREVEGVTRAWCYPGEMGAGTVTVRFVRDDDASPIPDAAELAAVFDYIDERRPVTAKGLYVVAPIPAPQDFVVALYPPTPAVKAAVEAALRDLLRREAAPEGGGGEGTILLTHVREAISLAAGETDHDLTSHTTNITLSTGEMATFGSIAWP